MAGRISDADKERVRDASRIEAVVGDYVALRRAGGGNFKGLCPFHDEKSPSFNVSPARASFHCFGCGEGGDVFAFVSRMEHLDFVETVQRLADRAGITLSLVEGGSSGRSDRGSRSRLIAANKAAAAFYAEQLAGDGGAAGRAFLAERGFDQAAAEHFGCGFAPAGWDSLITALTGQGFTIEELIKAGLAKQGRRGPIDQFHRRLLWSIRDGTGDVVGFGARRLFDDDPMQAKYVNTAETPVYRKSQLLYGLDLAKRDIDRQRRAVVVEGYTDVMAMHLAGVTTAVASCGTAFGDEHIVLLRRYLGDSDQHRAEVIYTFDGDEAGQKAAMKAFESDQRFAAETSVAIAPEGKDPCELRQTAGDEALRALVETRKPLFEFAVRTTLARFDLLTSESRVAAADATVPLVARIKREELREDYARTLANLLGAEPDRITRRVREAVAKQAAEDAQAARAPASPAPRRIGRGSGPEPVAPQEPAAPPGWEHPKARDQRAAVERETLKLALQQPSLVAGDYAQVQPEAFLVLAYRMIHEAIEAAGGPQATVSGPDWVTTVAEKLPAGPPRSLVSELMVEPVNVGREADAVYAGSILARMAERWARIQEADLRSQLQRAEAEGQHQLVHDLAADLQAMSLYRRQLGERAAGEAGP